MIDFIQNLTAGLSIGSIYALIGLGFIITVNGMGIVNMAHGETVMMGGFFAVMLSTNLGLPLIPSYLLAILGTVLFGYILNLTVVKPMINKPIFTVMIATIGLYKKKDSSGIYFRRNCLGWFPDLERRNLNFA